MADNSELHVVIVDNIKRSIPSGLNRALKTARGDYIVRLDAHSSPNNDYIYRCIRAIKDGRGDFVGGIWRIKPSGNSELASSIAAAAAHILGSGGTQYRVGGVPQEVDTVPFGAFDRDLVERIGYYNEDLLSNEDYEFTARIRNDGGIVWFDPNIQSTYYARSNLGDLAKQYWRYGYWKFQMLRSYPGTIRIRQILPFLLVLFFIGFSFLSFWSQFARWFLMFGALIYSIALLVAGLEISARHRNAFRLVGVPLALITMHFSWGTGFLWSVLLTVFRGF
jgi:cellulose synthase/poly-beta-1,6-N-acetylglucosamine synthase-like glycosyltransferase